MGGCSRELGACRLGIYTHPRFRNRGKVIIANLTGCMYCHRKFRPLSHIRLCYNDNLFERSLPMAKHRKFTPKFKAEVVLEALTPTFGVRVSDPYGISKTNLLLTLINFDLNKGWYFNSKNRHTARAPSGHS